MNPVDFHAMRNGAEAIPQSVPVAPVMAATFPPQAASPTQPPSYLSEIDALRNKAKAQIEEAIRCIPLEEKKAYLEALSKARSLCETETCPLKFLRRCDYDAWAAAHRLCLYWTERKKLFRERAFLPMVLTGDGALTRDDTLCLRAGYPAILPNAANGKQVVLLDRRQVFPTSSLESKIRCIFYTCNYLSQDERSQTEGLYCLVLMTVDRFRDLDREFVRRVTGLVPKIMPIRGKHFILNCPTPASKRYAVQDVLVSATSFMLENGISHENIEVMFEREQGEMLAHLLENGFRRHGLPSFLGGTWNFTKCAEWCRAQAQVEREQHKWELLVARQNHPKSSNDTKDQKAKKRERNLIYSRRKRDRRKQEVAKIQEEHDELLGERDALRAENERLQNLFDQANQIIGSLKEG